MRANSQPVTPPDIWRLELVENDRYLFAMAERLKSLRSLLDEQESPKAPARLRDGCAAETISSTTALPL
jgi:hypothetical protein